MGVVDLARDQHGNRVALKRLTLHGAASDIMRARQRLMREANVLRRLRHRNIVRLLDVVEEGDDIVLVMPYLNGGNLSERVGQHGPAPPDEVERLAQRLLGALATAHAAGIVHRDIKPANVLFDEQGEPCLADFGVAHTWDQTEGLTVAGMVVGTPGFMAPEQARDEPLTPASDIFSLGATLLFAATGTGPYGSGDPALLMVRSAAGKVERLPRSLPAGLRRRLRPMLNPKPNRRPTAAALLTGDQTALRRSPRLARRGRRNGPAAAFAAFAAAVAVVTVVVSTGKGGTDGDDAAVEQTDGQSATSVGAPGNDEQEADRPPEDPSGPGAPDAGEPGSVEPNDQLVDEIEATIAPGEVHSYVLPLGEPSRPDGCPRQVSLSLTTRGTMDLRLEVFVGTADKPDGAPLGDDMTEGETSASATFGPSECSSRERYWVEVSAPYVPITQPPVPYRIAREDS